MNTDTVPTLKLPGGKVITLNDQQVEAFTLMKDWLLSDGLFFTLSGYAGTGKTTITKAVIDWYKKQDCFKWNSIAVSAPTHKARKVIQRSTKRDSFTIQKLLGLRPNTDLDDFDINNPQFDPKAEKQIASYRFLIIDEASMLNRDLYDLIVEEATNVKTKVLFMGDAAQLPPVNESISKIFTDVPVGIELTKVERQSDSNPIMPIYDSIRSDLKSAVDLFPHVSKTNGYGQGIVFYDCRHDFEAEVLPLFSSSEYKQDPDFIKMIAYTNESVKAWNGKIRNHVHDSPKSPIIVGDILFAYNTVMPNMEEILIENSSDYKVLAVQECRADGIDVYQVELRSVDENKKSVVYVVRESGLKQFLAEHKRRLDSAMYAQGYKRKMAWRYYYEFKNNHLLQSDIRDENGQLIVKKDIDYGYAITCHKSQGSTFVNVAISENDIDRNQNHEERNKLKYVAFSRPTHKAIVFSNRK